MKTKKTAKSRDVAATATRKSKAPKTTTTAEKTAHDATGPRQNTKQAKVLELLRQKGGVTLDALVKETGWKANSVRGFISGAVGKKLGLKVESVKHEDGQRAYSIA